jgi:hypothetical protein
LNITLNRTRLLVGTAKSPIISGFTGKSPVGHLQLQQTQAGQNERRAAAGGPGDLMIYPGKPNGQLAAFRSHKLETE